MIRDYTEADASRCCEIIDACLPHMGDMNEAARDYVRNKNTPDILHNELKRGYTVCYETGDTVQGFGLLLGREIKRVYVDPCMQRQGIGRTLMQALEDEACRLGLVEVCLKSRPDAVSFYLTLGYRILKRDTLVSGAAHYSTITMSKNL